MLVGSSRPYTWLIFEENARWVDDDDDDDEDDIIGYRCWQVSNTTFTRANFD